jgi:hypothetical protein
MRGGPADIRFRKLERGSVAGRTPMKYTIGWSKGGSLHRTVINPASDRETLENVSQMVRRLV